MKYFLPAEMAMTAKLGVRKVGIMAQEVDGVIRQMHDERHVPILSFGEGEPLSVLMGLPPVVVVPEASAYPGYGMFCLLDGVNHINACKPLSKEDPSYTHTADFLRKITDPSCAKSNGP